MPYYGPRVLPQARESGASPFLTALGAGFNAFNETREGDRQKKRQEAADARDVEQHTANMARSEAARAGDELDLYNAGVRTGMAPDPLVLPGMGGGVSVVPRAKPLTEGRYIDTTQTPEFKARRDAQANATMAEESMRAFYEGAPDWFREHVGQYAPGTDYRGLYDDVLREYGDTQDRAATTERSTADRTSRESIAAANRTSSENMTRFRESAADRRAREANTSRERTAGIRVGGGGSGSRGLTPQQALTFGMNVQDGAEAGPDPALARQLGDSLMSGGALPSRDPSTGELVWPRPQGRPQEVDRPTYGEVLRDAMRTPVGSVSPSSVPAAAPQPRVAAGENPPPVAPKPTEAAAQSPPPPPPTEGGKPAKAPISEATKARARANPALRDALKKRFGYSDEDFEPSRQ